MSLLRMVLLLCVVSPLLVAAPTAEREWTSTAGTSLTAVAESITGGKVSFRTSSGRLLTVALDKLVDADRTFLMEHFKITPPKPGEPVDSGTPAASGLSQPMGQTVGPIETPEGSKYLLYIPKSLKEDRDAPFMLFTDASGGGPKIVDLMKQGAELNSWIVACSLDSRNKSPLSENNRHSANCVRHAISEYPVDGDRVYFTGSSGGAATAFANAVVNDHAGVLSSVGYIPGEAPKGGDYFICNGAIDFNRYNSAHAGETVGAKNSILRYHEGGHGKAPSWLMTDGMFWLNLRYLSGRGRKLEAERLDFEAAVLRWIQDIRGNAPHRAYHAAVQMKEEFKLSSQNAENYELVLRELGADENVRYVEGIEDLDHFGRRKLAPFGSSSKMQHTTPALESAAKQLSEKYAGVPQIEEIALKLGQQTDKLGK